MLRFLAAIALALPVGLATSARRSGDHRQADMKLCEHCGVASGSTMCCEPAAARCGECGTIAGSPGCCAK